MIWERAPYRISDDPAVVDLSMVHEFLAKSYWARGIPRETAARGIAHSLPFSVYLGDLRLPRRRLRDRRTAASLGSRRWLLATRDAHGLYRKFGVTAVADPSTLLTRHDLDIYTR
jgi:hypothetical protein